MSQIKTVTTVSGENEVVFDAFYAHVWFKNTGEGDVYVAPYSGFAAGDVDVSACPAGQMVRITARTQTVYILGASTLEIHAQNFSDCPFKVRAKGGEQITVTPLSVSENGVYTAPTGSAYSPVTVDVQEQPWEPLEDGYSNFWVNIPTDRKTLALNLYSKSESAVIDWGDGTGEVALDTLTPTHTYSKAGKYIVKVKGVTGIGQLSTVVGNGIFTDAFEYIELNNEVITAVSYMCRYLASLKDISCSASLYFGTGTFQYCGLLSAFTVNYPTISANQFNQCFSLRNITLSRNVTSIGGTAFGLCVSLNTISIPDTVTAIDNYAFRYCTALSEIHMAATVPPTLGTDVFAGIASGFVIYVPVGTGDTYKAASGWSAYADHIVEEGQTLSKAALRRIQAEEKTIDESEVR